MKRSVPRTVIAVAAVSALALGNSLVGAPSAIAAGTSSVAAPAATSGSLSAASNAAVDAYLAAHPTAYHRSAGDALVPQAVVVGGNGLHYYPYQRTHRGLPVVGGDFVVTTDAAGVVLGLQVAQSAPIGTLSLSPRISAARASVVSQGRMKVESLARPAEAAAPRLVVLAGSTAKLAWESEVVGTTSEGPSKLAVYVDAATGAVLHQQEKVLHGSGSSAYNGPVQIDTTNSGTTFTMKDSSRTNLSCQDAANNTVFSGTDDAWGNGVASNRETGCVDALFAAQTEWKMLGSWLGRNGFTGSGGGYPIRVGLNDINAYYDGTQVQVGHSQSGNWIGSIDVVAHEFGHAIDDNTPGGISSNGTQEFVADTFGAATEWYANEAAPNDTPDYTVGEEVNLVGQGPIRVMYKPSTVGDDDCYSSSTPTDEVHAAAGPGNHWFYLLAEGTNPTDGQPTSPTCNGSTVGGIGIQKAITIMYNAMLTKTSSASYLKYRAWTLTAAKNLYPGSCTEFNAVKAAWTAVSVPAQSGEPTCGSGTTVTVTSPGSQSSTVGAAVSVQLAAGGGTSPYTWSATGLPAGLSIYAAGKITGTPTSGGTSSVTAKATDAGGTTGTTTFSWTVSTSGGGGSCSGQKLGNAGFESGNVTWTASTGAITNDSSAAAHGGSWMAWLDGYGSSHTDTLSQTVTIPAGCSKATLTYYLWIDSDEGTGTAYDTLTVAVNGTTKATWSNVNKGTGYVQRSLSLTGLSGSTTVKFTGTEDRSAATSFLLDDVALTVTG
ncbi:M4 family metallopeptidase [Nakamurella sp. A5-74]|uniref:M4 family metallopeptidase n=1 Tax=Nakamurella sp. A5-74 TaxID=3158264 RepID=A0AAU8DUS6_9ACTN